MASATTQQQEMQVQGNQCVASNLFHVKVVGFKGVGKKTLVKWKGHFKIGDSTIYVESKDGRKGEGGIVEVSVLGDKGCLYTDLNCKRFRVKLTWIHTKKFADFLTAKANGESVNEESVQLYILMYNLSKQLSVNKLRMLVNDNDDGLETEQQNQSQISAGGQNNSNVTNQSSADAINQEKPIYGRDRDTYEKNQVVSMGNIGNVMSQEGSYSNIELDQKQEVLDDREMKDYVSIAETDQNIDISDDNKEIPVVSPAAFEKIDEKKVSDTNDDTMQDHNPDVLSKDEEKSENSSSLYQRGQEEALYVDQDIRQINIEDYSVESYQIDSPTDDNALSQKDVQELLERLAREQNEESNSSDQSQDNHYEEVIDQMEHEKSDQKSDLKPYELDQDSIQMDHEDVRETMHHKTHQETRQAEENVASKGGNQKEMITITPEKSEKQKKLERDILEAFRDRPMLLLGNKIDQRLKSEQLMPDDPIESRKARYFADKEKVAGMVKRWKFRQHIEISAQVGTGMDIMWLEILRLRKKWKLQQEAQASSYEEQEEKQ